MSARTLRRLRHLARRADVVVAHGSTTLSACAVALVGARKPFIYVNIGDPRYWARSGIPRVRVRLLMSRAAAVAAISPQSAHIIETEFGVPACRIAIVPNGRDSDRFFPPSASMRAQARHALQLSSDRPVLLALGSLSHEKRIDLAIRAAGELENVQLLIAGDGPLRNALEALALEKMGSVVFAGALGDPRQAIYAADAVMMTSDSEGVPGVLIEAGMCGVPAVARDVGFVRDVIVDGITGVVVPGSDVSRLTEGISLVLAHRESMGELAREHCLRTFDLARVAALWRNLLRRVAADG
jgi:glycosyltransferase involved in cell wall biosynthesis